MSREDLAIERERTSRELLKALMSPPVLFVGGLMAIMWYTDRPGGPGQVGAVPMWGALAGVCAAQALAPSLPYLATSSGDLVKLLAPAAGALALVAPK